MSFLNVFMPSLTLTAIVGIFMALTWREVRNPYPAAAYWGFALSVHVGWANVPRLDEFAPIARWLAITWLGGMLSAAVLLIPFAALTILSRWPRLKPIRFYLPMTYAGCFVLAGIILAFTSTESFVVRREDILIPDLPTGLDGFRIANLGDVHLGRFIDVKELRRGIEAINEERVDLLAITGDLVDDVSQLEASMQVLEQSNAPYTVAILGNHEETGNLRRILAIYGRHRAHINLLINENTAINRGGATLRIVGVDFPLNHVGRRLPRGAQKDAAMSAQADQAFTGLNNSEMIVALSHQPEFFPFAASHGALLTLASHTHGGQLRLFGRPVIDVFPYLQGIYRDGDSYLDVSAGFGHWLPIRFGVPREIVIDTLRRGTKMTVKRRSSVTTLLPVP